MDDDPMTELEQALQKCAQTAIWAMPQQKLVDYLDRMHALAPQFDALRLEMIREVDARHIPIDHGAANTTTWLRDRYRLSPGTAARHVKLATTLHTQLPHTAAALADGTITTEQAQLIANTIRTVPPEFRADGEKLLLNECANLGPKELSLAAGRLVELVAPEIAEQREAKRLARLEKQAHANRAFHLTDLDDGARVRLSGWLDRESAAKIRAAIDPLCAPQPNTGNPDLRTPGQRRADALVDVCKLVMACGKLPDNGGDRPQLTLFIDFDKLREQIGTATLDDGTILSPAAARRLACDTEILPAVMGSAGQVLDVGRKRRLFTGSIRRALVLRDRGCAFPACDRPPRWCDGHHVLSWLDGGPTSLSNGVLLCGHHHRVIHQGQWQVRIAADGLPEFIPPAYIDLEQQPRRNIYHRRE